MGTRRKRAFAHAGGRVRRFPDDLRGADHRVHNVTGKRGGPRLGSDYPKALPYSLVFKRAAVNAHERFQSDRWKVAAVEIEKPHAGSLLVAFADETDTTELPKSLSAGGRIHDPLHRRMDYVLAKEARIGGSDRLCLGVNFSERRLYARDIIRRKIVKKRNGVNLAVAQLLFGAGVGTFSGNDRGRTVPNRCFGAEAERLIA